MRETQKMRVLALLYDGKEHSSSEIRDLTPKIVQAVTRVWELQKEDGYDIRFVKLAPTNGIAGAPVAWYQWDLSDPKRMAFAEKYDFRQVEPVDPKQMVMETGGAPS